MNMSMRLNFEVRRWKSYIESTV